MMASKLRCTECGEVWEPDLEQYWATCPACEKQMLPRAGQC